MTPWAQFVGWLASRGVTGEAFRELPNQHANGLILIWLDETK
jgi:hypothetical protein